MRQQPLRERGHVHIHVRRRLPVRLPAAVLDLLVDLLCRGHVVPVHQHGVPEQRDVRRHQRDPLVQVPAGRGGDPVPERSARVSLCIVRERGHLSRGKLGYCSVVYLFARRLTTERAPFCAFVRAATRARTAPLLGSVAEATTSGSASVLPLASLPSSSPCSWPSGSTAVATTDRPVKGRLLSCQCGLGSATRMHHRRPITPTTQRGCQSPTLKSQSSQPRYRFAPPL